MKKAIIVALALAGCGSPPPEHGGLNGIGVTEMSARLSCPFDNVRIENFKRGMTKTTWNAVCTAPKKAMTCTSGSSGTKCLPK